MAYRYGVNMKTQELKTIIEQIKKYNLTEAFSSPEQLDEWLKSLNNTQIHNLITLDINPNELTTPRNIIINKNILNCSDYKQKLRALSKVQNCEGFYHLFERFCSIYFLSQPSFYDDVKLISEADSSKYALWVIGEESFNKSPYRNEDLKVILGAKDTPKEDGERQKDWLVAEALAKVAKDKNSINSKYHREDMELISISGSDCLQMSGCYPDYGLNKLAVNEVSLNDPYHLENMQILAENSAGIRYLYLLMTDKDAIKSPTYRQEIQALRHAKSEVTALAMYNFIKNPKISLRYNDISNLMQQYNLNYLNAYSLGRNKTIRGNQTSNYIENLYLLNTIDDEYVLFFASLLSDKYLNKSGYLEKDLELISTITHEGIFMDLYELMTNEESLESIHHLEDVKLVSEEQNKQKRKLYMAAATDKNSLNSINHRFDMEYLSKLEIEDLDKKFMDNVHYYIFNNNGIRAPHHVEILEKLYNGTPIEEVDEIAEYISQIENNIDEYVRKQPEKKGFLSRILKRK